VARLNPRAWAVWVVAASLPALIGRNPMVLILAVLAVAVVRTRIEGESRHRALPLWRLGLTMILVATLWNALTAHYGDTLLLTLPGSLPLIGGRVTLEAALFGLTNGLAVWLFFAAFNTFSLAITPYQMLSLAPRAVRHAGLVVSIALTFFPQALRTAREVREAQAVRGYRPRHLRDLTAMIVPLLLNSLESAAQIAEAMEARGYAHAQGRPTHLGWMALITGSLIQMYWPAAIAGWALIAIGAGWLFVSARAGGSTTRYRRERWSMADTLAVLAALASMGILVFVSINDASVLAYYPYPRATLPLLDVRVVMAMLVLVAPAVSVLKWKAQAQESVSEA